VVIVTAFVSIWVDGVAETKGSWISLGHGRVKADNPREKAWATAVGWAAKLHLRGAAPRIERIGVTLLLRLPPRPNKTKKNQRDIDKLARSILDALSGIAYVDDEQVDQLTVNKVVAEDRPGAQIDVRILPQHATAIEAT
jgi:crossover junction endodeoxyribonuclease RusA